MRDVLTVLRLQLKLTLSAPGMIIFMILPLLFTFVFGYAMEGASATSFSGIPLAVVSEEPTFAADKLVKLLEQERLVRVRRVDRAAMDQLFANKQAASGVIIPAGFQAALQSGKEAEVQLVRAPGGNMEVAVGPALNRAVTQVAVDYRLALRQAGSTGDAAALERAWAQIQEDRTSSGATVQVGTVGDEGAGQRGMKAGDAALGFIVMFVMMLVFMQGGTILQERQAGTWGRILTTPVPKGRIMTGYLLSFYLTGMLQFSALATLSTLIFAAEWGPLLPLAAIASAFVLCTAGLGLFLAGIVRTAEQQRTIGTVLVTATSMLGGVYWPLDFVSPVMQRIGYLTPQAWAMDGFREVIIRGGSWAGLTWPLAVLLGLTAVFMTAGMLRVRFE